MYWEDGEACKCPALLPSAITHWVEWEGQQQQPLWVQLWIMGVTFLYLVTRYYGDKNSTNTSQRIRPHVFRSSLRSTVLSENNLWWWTPLSCFFSYVAVLEYPLLGWNTTSDAIYNPVYLVDSLLIVTSEQQSSCTLQSPGVKYCCQPFLQNPNSRWSHLPLNMQWVIHCKLHLVMAGSLFKPVYASKGYV